MDDLAAAAGLNVGETGSTCRNALVTRKRKLDNDPLVLDTPLPTLTTTEGRIKRHSCSFCSYSTDYKTSFSRHILTHTGEKPHQCSLCTYRCAVKSSLTRHMLTHTGEKLFHCTTCSYKCTLKSSLTKHQQRVHEGLKGFVCVHCPYQCGSKGRLTRHSRMAHADII